MDDLSWRRIASNPFDDDNRKCIDSQSSLNLQEQSTQRCTICKSMFNLPRQDGSVEKASMLPCSHIFGDMCIQRWVETSPNNDCPICRRSMLYRTCKHMISACNVERAPAAVAEEDLPDKCKRCRLEDVGNGMAKVRARKDALEAQERALVGLKQHLPGLFGGLCRTTVASVDGRIEKLRKDWEKGVEPVIGEVEENDGRVEW